ncbi:hypothetical protein PV325_010064 [Microctonus aethiopoides]|nr:hypothetical protein PV325_010064 [Microctonus aethiopoides]KAK0095779.1 hypothetical protein PV326_007418 [Microctonus aethiopoides]KAK0159979.1 hypothetical protein PV328_007433 [Microctonus aethiopoides]
MPSKINSKLLTVSLLLLNCSIFHTSESIPICKSGLEYWSDIQLSCTPCTKCAPEFTISPCAIHKDAICGPLSALELDWPFSNNKRNIKTLKDEINQRDNENNKLWQFSEMEISPVALRQLNNDKPSEFNEKNDELFNSYNERELNYANNINNNKLSWDLQTSALVLAVCACIIFFLVAGCSAIIYMRQWRRMKRNFEPAGLEEISARLNLMVKAELAELTAGAPMNPGDPEIRCQYLEKLLDRKRETPTVVTDNGWPDTGGNLYIEEGAKSTRCKRAQIARIHHNIESILSHKAMMNRE